MKDAILQLQMSVPSLKTDASITATLRKDQDLLMEFDTETSFSETSYKQKVSLKYGNCQPSLTSSMFTKGKLKSLEFLLTDDDKFEVDLKSNLNSEIEKLIPNIHDHHTQLQHLIDNILDQQVAKTDMKLRHIVTKGIEVQ